MATKPKSKKSAPKTSPTQPSLRKKLSQSDVPGLSLEKALRIPNAINENYAKQPTKPLMVAQALQMSPASGPFRQLCGASIAYGLTDGGYNADQISLTPLGIRIVSPTKENDDLLAKREAILRPRVLKEFIQKYNGSPIPQGQIALNVLEDIGVPREKTQATYDLILESCESVGVITEIKGKKYINYENEDYPKPEDPGQPEQENNGQESPLEALTPPGKPTTENQTEFFQRKKRVFITHGKKKNFIPSIKKLLEFGELEPVVSTEKQSVSQPVPDKVMADMRSCGGAIVHVDTDHAGEGSSEQAKNINPNVLIEIGAAMALYGRRFILLVEDGLKLPSNLQGLYEVRYSGENLDSDVTIKLLEAIKDIKNYHLPEEKHETK